MDQLTKDERLALQALGDHNLREGTFLGMLSVIDRGAALRQAARKEWHPEWELVELRKELADYAEEQKKGGPALG